MIRLVSTDVYSRHPRAVRNHGRRPAPKVEAWIAGERDFRSFHHSDLSVDILSRLGILLEGWRHSALEPAAAFAYVGIFPAGPERGRPVAPLVLMIATVAPVHDNWMVTRELLSFEDCRVTLVKPWHF